MNYTVIMPVPWPFWGLFERLGWEPYYGGLSEDE